MSVLEFVEIAVVPKEPLQRALDRQSSQEPIGRPSQSRAHSQFRAHDQSVAHHQSRAHNMDTNSITTRLNNSIKHW